MSVVVVGSLNVDLHLRPARHPLPGETLLAGGGGFSPGGKGANQACAAALAGAPTTMLGAVGSDGSAATALALLRDAGVDLGHVVEVPGPTGLAVVTVADDGENTVVVVPGANAAVGSETIHGWARLISGAGIVVCQGEISAEATGAVARLVRGRWLLNLAPVIPLPPDVIRRADPLVVNEHEAALVLGQLAPAPEMAPDPGSGPRDLVDALLGHGIASLVLTLGADGALVGDDTGVHHVPSPSVVAVDTVGAGDAFAGILAARLADGASLVDAARSAARFAAATVRFDGAQASYRRALDSLAGQ